MDRENEDWLSHLNSKGPSQEGAISDLRVLLLRRLRHGLPGGVGQDESFLDDICQEALLRILAKLDVFEGRSQFLTWATSIAVRVALTELRRRRWGSVSINDLVGDLPGRINETSPTEGEGSDGSRHEVFNCLRRVIETELTEKQRTALQLELKGMPQEEIARQLSTSRNALYKLTHDARKSVKRAMESAGYSADEILTRLARWGPKLWP